MSAHYIAMSGMHGCLPDHCEVFETRADAVTDLTSLFELGRIRETRLKENGYLELEVSLIEAAQGDCFGADYCEISACNCATPEIHSDSGD
jgi:hypothetical protein